MTDIVYPKFNGTAFNCPICGAYAKQHWHETALGNKNSTWTCLF